MRRRVVAIVAAVGAGLLLVVAFYLPRAGPDAADPMESERASDGAPPAILEAPASGDLAGRQTVSGTRDGGAMDTASGEQAPTPELRASLRLEMVDAATGVSVPATWNVFSRVDAALLRALERRGDVTAPTADQDEVARRVIERWEAGFLPSGAVRPDALVHQVDWNWGVEVASPPISTPVGSITVRPPSGYCAPGPVDGMPYGLHELSQLLAAGVREAVAVVPLHREAVLHLRVLGPDDRPAVGAAVRSVVVGRRRGAVEDVGPGEFRVLGIPHLPGEPVAIAIDWIVEGAVATRAIEPGPPTETEEVRGIEDVDAPDATSVVPADLSRPWSVVLRLTGPTGPRIVDHNETDNDLPTEEWLSAGSDHVPAGTVRVTVLGWDGRPVAGATVFGHATDADGVVVLSRILSGECEFWTRPDGRFPARAAAVVPEGGQVDVVLREPVGAILDVLVTDAEGDPRPSALLTVSGARVFDVVDLVQRLDRFTDARGRRTFARVEPGDVTVHASWGSRHGSATVTLRDGERASLHIVAK